MPRIAARTDKLTTEEFKKLNSPHSKSKQTHAVFIDACKRFGLPEPTPEYKFHPTRKWRFDFCWPNRMIAVEIEGGLFTGGRHTRGRSYINDLTKYNEATKAGYKLYRFDTDSVKDLTALVFLKEAENWL